MTISAPRLSLHTPRHTNSNDGSHALDAPQPSVTRMTVTPNMAMNWLDNVNTNNRNVSDAHVQRLVRDMKQGKWVLTHEGIAFDSNGILLDGQHRLWAIAYADVPIEMHIWRDVTRDALMAIDCGKSRGLSDVLRLSGGHGKVHRSEIAVLRAMLGGFSTAAPLSAAEASVALGMHGEAIAFSIEVLPAARRITTAITRAVIARAYYSADHEQLRDFGRMLSSGVVPDAGAISVVLLRQFLAERAGSSRNERLARYAKTQRALVAFLCGERINRLHAACHEHFPLPEEASRS